MEEFFKFVLLLAVVGTVVYFAYNLLCDIFDI
jgi:hypothetical protein